MDKLIKLVVVIGDFITAYVNYRNAIIGIIGTAYGV
jgi:hypothetical protein